MPMLTQRATAMPVQICVAGRSIACTRIGVALCAILLAGCAVIERWLPADASPAAAAPGATAAVAAPTPPPRPHRRLPHPRPHPRPRPLGQRYTSRHKPKLPSACLSGPSPQPRPQRKHPLAWRREHGQTHHIGPCADEGGAIAIAGTASAPAPATRLANKKRLRPLRSRRPHQRWISSRSRPGSRGLRSSVSSPRSVKNQVDALLDQFRATTRAEWK